MIDPMEEMKQKWLAGMEARLRDRSRSRSVMAPWDEQVFFQPVMQSQFLAAAGNVQQVAKADPMRVALIFNSQTTDSVNISTQPNPDQRTGILLPPASFPYMILQHQTANLCQSDWYGFFRAGSVLNVIEIRLKEWPT